MARTSSLIQHGRARPSRIRETGAAPGKLSRGNGRAGYPGGCCCTAMKTTARTLAFGFAALAGGLLGPSAAAFAQNVNPTPQVNPSENLATPEPQPPISPNVEHLFGDWGGLRTYLGRYGINVLLDNTNEFASNI